MFDYGVVIFKQFHYFVILQMIGHNLTIDHNLTVSYVDSVSTMVDHGQNMVNYLSRSNSSYSFFS